MEAELEQELDGINEEDDENSEVQAKTGNSLENQEDDVPLSQ